MVVYDVGRMLRGFSDTWGVGNSQTVLGKPSASPLM